MIRGIFLIGASFITSALVGADFDVLFDKVRETLTPETVLFDRIFALPKELRIKIFTMAQEENKQALKKHAQETLKISEFRQYWYNIEHYFAFKKFGTECTHIIAFYPKKNSPHDTGIIQTPLGINKNAGASALVFSHTIDSNKIQTKNLIKQQEEAPLCFNGINLATKEWGWVYCLKNNYLERDCKIKKGATCIVQ